MGVIAGFFVLLAILLLVYLYLKQPSHWAHFKAFVCCRHYDDAAMMGVRRESMGLQKGAEGVNNSSRRMSMGRRPSMNSLAAEQSLPPLDGNGAAPVQVYVKGPNGHVSLDVTSMHSLEQIKQTMSMKGFNENYKLVFEPKDKEDGTDGPTGENPFANVPPPKAAPHAMPHGPPSMLVRRPSLTSPGDNAVSPLQRKLSGSGQSNMPHFNKAPVFGSLNKVGPAGSDGVMPPLLSSPSLNRPGLLAGGPRPMLPRSSVRLPGAAAPAAVPVSTTPSLMDGAHEIITIPIPPSNAPPSPPTTTEDAANAAAAEASVPADEASSLTLADSAA
jgi:hypothetical protein